MINEVKKKIGVAVPEPKLSLWVVKNINSTETFDNEKDILVYMKGYYQSIEEYEKEKEELIKKFDDHFFSNMVERMNILEPELFRYDYLEKFDDLTDVFVINKLRIVDSKLEIQKTIFKTISNKNSKRVVYSLDGVNWNYSFGDLSDLYLIFKNNGIELKKDLYNEEKDMSKKIYVKK